jgi:hypothetical protein
MMKLSKQEALVLIKALHGINPSFGVASAFGVEPTPFDAHLQHLKDRLDDFVLCEFSDEDAAEEEDEEEADETDEEDEDVEAVEDEEEETDSCALTPLDLAELGSLKTDRGKASFYVDGACAHLQFDDADDDEDIEEVTSLKRYGAELHVCDYNGEWHVLKVNRFPKRWVQGLPLEQLFEVEE